jgi:hypothetical protein
MRRLSRSRPEADRVVEEPASLLPRIGLASMAGRHPAGLDSLHSARNNLMFMSTLAEAAAFASGQLGMVFKECDIQGLIDLGLLTNFAIDGDSGVRLLSTEIESDGVLADWVSEDWVHDNLLAEVDIRQPIPRPSPELKAGSFILTIDPALRLLVPASAFRPYECQLFLREFRRIPRSAETPLSASQTVFVQVGNVRFQATSQDLAQFAAEIWRGIADRADNATEAERRTTLSIYGVKDTPSAVSHIRDTDRSEERYGHLRPHVRIRHHHAQTGQNARRIRE